MCKQCVDKQIRLATVLEDNDEVVYTYGPGIYNGTRLHPGVEESDLVPTEEEVSDAMFLAYFFDALDPERLAGAMEKAKIDLEQYSTNAEQEITALEQFIHGDVNEKARLIAAARKRAMASEEQILLDNGHAIFASEIKAAMEERYFEPWVNGRRVEVVPVVFQEADAA